MPLTTVTVFGGSSFLGRQLVRRLAAEGATLRIAVRSPDRARNVLGAVDLDRVTVFRADVRDQASVAAAVAGVDAVVNAVSAYVEKPGVTFESVHELAAKTLAHEAAAAGVARSCSSPGSAPIRGRDLRTFGRVVAANL